MSKKQHLKLTVQVSVSKLSSALSVAGWESLVHCPIFKNIKDKGKVIKSCYKLFSFLFKYNKNRKISVISDLPRKRRERRKELQT